MRKVTQKVCRAFEYQQSASCGNSHTDGSALFLHGNKIAEWRDGELFITNAGWSTNTTKERLNGLHGVNIHQKDYTWYLNGVEWDGSWVKVSEHIRTPRIKIAEDSEREYFIAQ